MRASEFHRFSPILLFSFFLFEDDDDDDDDDADDDADDEEEDRRSRVTWRDRVPCQNARPATASPATAPATATRPAAR